MNKRARRMWRNGWISMTALTAVIILLGVGLAFGMDALLPSYTGRLLALSEDLLSPVYEMSDQSLTIYPWNLYTEEAAAPLDHEEQLSLQQRAQQITEIIGILWQKEYVQAESENEIVWELPDVSSVMQDFTRGKAVDGSPLYFLKEKPLYLSSNDASMNARVMLSCVYDKDLHMLYFHGQPESDGDSAITVNDIQNAAVFIRDLLHSGDELMSYPFIHQLTTLMKSQGWDLSLGERELRRAEVLTTDDEILVICTSDAGDEQLVLFLNPWYISLNGYSIQA